MPEETEYIEPLEEDRENDSSTRQGCGYEKACRSCGAVMPFDSLFCSQCGGTLKKRDEMRP